MEIIFSDQLNGYSNLTTLNLLLMAATVTESSKISSGGQFEVMTTLRGLMVQLPPLLSATNG